MSLLDRSPGAFFFVANAILYTVVIAEVAMLASGSVAAMVAVMILIIFTAALLCRWILNLMGPEDHALDYEPQRAKAPAPAAAPVAAPAERRRPLPVPTGRPVAH